MRAVDRRLLVAVVSVYEFRCCLLRWLAFPLSYRRVCCLIDHCSLGLRDAFSSDAQPFLRRGFLMRENVTRAVGIFEVNEPMIFSRF